MSSIAYGLTAAEARARLVSCGRNELLSTEGVSSWRVVLASQFQGAMIWLLAAAAAISALLGETVDAAAIGAIVVLNSAVGFFQEYRAEKAILALRSMAAPRARVRRDGRVIALPAAEVVPGDILLLEGGDIVAADGRLTEAHDVRAIESALTGESLPVHKRIGRVPDDAPLAERTNQVFLGTAIATGRGTAEVTATGMSTEMGRIARLLATAHEPRTSLQVQLDALGRTLLALCLGIVAVVFVLGVVRAMPWIDLLLSSVALAVAAIPEGLPVVVTIALALGVRRMAGRNALVRRLAAVETLGCATVICTDKTGTLTTGRMEVREVHAGDRREVLRVAAACCDAELHNTPGQGVGDPTEIALLAAAAGEGIHRADIERAIPRVAEHPFDSTRRRMSIRRADGILYVKGAPEAVIPLCTVGTEGAAEAVAPMARRALRVLAVATGRGEREEDLRLIGLVGLADPPRPEAAEAVARSRAAGIRTVMITGDHPSTARVIAEELGIAGDGRSGSVYARATAEDKIGIVRTLERDGEIVAMTGDGVNDAPALREAHIGIAMGRGGTDVTREAADVILTDDNYATIVSAVEEGRGIYDNIRKTLVFLLTGSASELWLMLGASLAGLPLPLLPIHLLWINLVTDGLPAAALVTDPADHDVLKRPPRRATEPILGRREWRRILALGFLEGMIVLGTFAWAFESGVTRARTIAFSTLVFCELFRALAARSSHRLYWQVGVASNFLLMAIVGVTAAIQALLPTVPALRSVFYLVPLSWADTAVCVGVGLLPVSILEISKLIHGAGVQGHSPAMEGVWRLADPKITTASLASLFLGAAAAARGGPLSWWWLAATVLGIVCVEIAKNASGEVVDLDSGADHGVAPEDRSPFSGGKRVLVEGLLSRSRVTGIAAAGYAGAIGIGIAVAVWREPSVLAVGVVGLAFAFFYHAPPVKLAYRGFGELAVAACYGPLIAGGAYVVQRGVVTADVILPSLPLGLMVAAFLWINEFPDRRADTRAGKRTLVVRLGPERASRAFLVLVVAAYVLVLLLPLAGAPVGVLLGLAGVPLGMRAARRLSVAPTNTASVIPAQGWTLASFLLLAAGEGLGLLLF